MQPLVLDDQNNELNLSIPSRSALSIATFKITTQANRQGYRFPKPQGNQELQKNNLFIAHYITT